MNRKNFAALLTLFSMLVALPLAGIWGAGMDLAPFLAFPPPGLYVRHAPLSAAAFILYSAAVAAALAPFLRRFASGRRMQRYAGPEDKPAGRFPWWGWFAAGLCAVSWVFAWTRFEFFAPLQLHTFFPLWFGLTLAANGLCVRAGGRPAMLQAPGRWALLFPLSAGFWWSFEWLNRFTQNWTYANVESFTAEDYFWLATVSFSTVLPAVLAVKEWLQAQFDFHRAVVGFAPMKIKCSRGAATAALALCAANLLFLGSCPNLLFATLWVTPLIIFASLQSLLGNQSILSPLARGDWSAAVLWASAALVCGFFWECWNFYSLAKWEYHVPYVQVLHIFEMPLLGYAGYIPFGIFCGAITEAFLRTAERTR